MQGVDDVCQNMQNLKNASLGKTVTQLKHKG